MDGGNLQKLVKSTKKKNFIYPIFVFVTCVVTMIWSVVNGELGRYRGTIYCKVYLVSSYLALWTIIIICWNTRGLSL